MIKSEKGITLLSLVIIIALMTIISSTVVYMSLDRFEINNFSKMKNDIILLDEKVSNYYLRYNVLPVLREDDGTKKLYTYTSLDFEKNSGDNSNYYILDLEAMEGISLNYGEEGFKTPNSSDDVYIINEETHTIYYVRGIELNGEQYYYLNNETNIVDNIPPTKPQIKVISGKKNASGIYTTDVQVEIIPGKDNASGISSTTYSVNGGEYTLTPENSIFTIAEEGKYEIIAKSYDDYGNISYDSKMEIEVVKPQIGDKVAYNELSKGTKTYSIDYTQNGGTSVADNQTLSTENLEWRILDIEDDGTIKLISTNPTTSKIYLNGENGYLNVENILNNTCSMLYGNGANAIMARALNQDDIEKITGVITYEQKKNLYANNQYGEKWLYRFSNESQYIQYSSDRGKTWTDTATFTKFKVPGREEINSKKHGEKEIECTYYYMRLDIKITTTARDGLSMADLIIKGEDNESYITQWLASTCVNCTSKVAAFQARTLDQNMLYYYRLIYSNGAAQSNSLSFRPVVFIRTNSIVNRDDNGVLQLNAE